MKLTVTFEGAYLDKRAGESDFTRVEEDRVPPIEDCPQRHLRMLPLRESERERQSENERERARESERNERKRHLRTRRGRWTNL